MREIKFRIWDELTKKMTYVNHYTPNTRPKYIWMQYTGLKDKNGKEIYEGDIFDCIYKEDGCKHRLLVIWDEDDARFKLKNFGECDQPNVTQTFSDMQRHEVIGNIYENPELLTSKTNKAKEKQNG